MLTDYAGAGSRLTPAVGLALDPGRWGWMAKVDGCYARVSTDRRGRVFSVLARSGLPVADARDLVGVLVGPPDSVLHGELESHTEAGNRLASIRGWRALHLFDVSRRGGQDVTSAPFIERHRMLVADRLELTAAGTVNPWTTDDHGQVHDARTGRYARPVPRDHRRFPLVPLERDPDRLWRDHVVRGGGEGVVAVRLDGRLGARGSKRKIKTSDTLDCTVIAVDREAALLSYRSHMFTVSARGKLATRLAVGAVVEVQADGWYEATPTPRFARIVRVRADL